MKSEFDLLLQQKQEIVDEIVSYMKFGAAEDAEDEEYDPDFEPGYCQEHVDQCDTILTKFLADTHSHSGKEEAIIQDVKTAVLSLNALNIQCEHAMIETDQRESICAMIDSALAQVGMNPEGDITEQWREW